MPWNARRSRGLGLALSVLLVAAVSGCATPEYRFIGGDERDLVIKVPRSWTLLDNAAAMKASGIDPASTATWTAFYDAAAKPAIAHVKSISTADPFMFAQSIPIAAEKRDSITDGRLREVVLPGTPAVRDEAIQAKDFAILADERVSKPKQHGVHVRYSFTIDGTPEIYDRIALTDTKGTAVHILFVHCTRACFDAHPEISDIVTSLTVKSP